MADGFAAIDEPTSGATDKRVDAEERTVNALSVLLQRIRIAGASNLYADVTASNELKTADAATLAKVEAVRAILAGTVAVADSASLAKLEAIRALVDGTVDVADAAALAKLDAILLEQDNVAPGTSHSLANTPTAALTTMAAVTFTADNTTDTLTSTAHGLVNGDSVLLSSTTTLPAGLVGVTPTTPINPAAVLGVITNYQREYFVVGATANTFQVAATSGGTAVNFTDNGTGTHSWQKPSIYLGSSWVDIEHLGGYIFLWANQPVANRPANVQLQFSADQSTVATTTTLAVKEVLSAGLTYNVYLSIASSWGYKYVRVRVVSGTAATTGAPIAIFYKLRYPFQGTYGYLDANLTFFSQALLTRAVLAGITPTGDFVNVGTTASGDLRTGIHVSASTANSTTATLAAGDTWTGTAEDVADYAQLNVTLYARPSTIQGDGTNARASLFLEFSPDGTNWDISIPTLVRDPGLFIPVPLIFAGRYFRARYVNDGGASAISLLGLTAPDAATSPVAQTQFRLTTSRLPSPTKELTRTLDQGVTGSDPVVLTRSVLAGKSPAGGFVNVPAGGDAVANRSTTPLGSGAIYTGAWETCASWASLALLVATDQVSATDGIVIQFSDTLAGTSIRSRAFFTFTAASVSAGFLYVTVSPRAAFFRILYTNGGTPQGSFYLRVSLSPVALELPRQSVEGAVAASSGAVMTRSVLNAANASGVYDNIARGTSGGLNVGIVQHVVETPIKSLTTFKVTRTSVGTTAVKAVSIPQSGRRSIALKAIASGSAILYVGHTSGVTTSTGYPLNNQEFLEMDLDDASDVWIIASSGTQAVSVLEIY